jgi:hypothetical protein
MRKKCTKLNQHNLGHEKLEKLDNLKSSKKSEKLREITEFCNSALNLFLKVLDCCYLIHLQVFHYYSKLLYFLFEFCLRVSSSWCHFFVCS